MQISGLNADDKFESNPNNARLFGSKRKIQTRYEFKNLRSRSCYHASSKAVKNVLLENYTERKTCNCSNAKIQFWSGTVFQVDCYIK